METFFDEVMVSLTLAYSFCIRVFPFYQNISNSF